jgi:WD40-like Beta Propeller Repeat
MGVDRAMAVRLWNADTGQQIGQPLAGRTDSVTSVAFSPDGRRLAFRRRRRHDPVVARTGQPGRPVFETDQQHEPPALEAGTYAHNSSVGRW